MPDDIREYTLKATSSSSAEVEEIDLGISDGAVTRRVLRATIIRNPHSANKSIRATIVHQRRANEASGWEDLDAQPLTALKAREAAKLDLDSDQTMTLFEHLGTLYGIGSEGIKPGRIVTAFAGVDSIISTQPGRAEILRKLLDEGRGQELWDAIDANLPNLSESLAKAKMVKEREKVIAEMETSIALTMGEEYWQQLLKNNRWVFGSCYIATVGERRINIKSTVDHPLVCADGCLEIIELKKPELYFWKRTNAGALYLYRNKYRLPAAELEGAIAQATNYIHEAEVYSESERWIAQHDGIRPFKPKAIVVFGRSKDWDRDDQLAFRLLNDRLQGVSVMTFDHLIARAKQALNTDSSSAETDERLYVNPDETP